MWIVTEQFCDDPKSIRSRTVDFDEVAMRDRLKYRFHLLCGDGELYYEGLMDCDPDEPKRWSTKDGPDDALLDFGRPRFGCSRVQVLANGHWLEFTANYRPRDAENQREPRHHEEMS